MVDPRIETFLTLCKVMNYRKTAEILNMTQPAVTQHIHYLENLYRCKLFEYDRKTLTMTRQAKILKEYAKKEPRITVKAVKTKYPQGAERTLIYATTGRKINSSMLPADAGCVVNNVDTVVAVYRAVTEGRPLMERIVTVTGDAIANPQNYRIRIGMNYNELIEAAGGFKVQPEKIICGGPMMGFSMIATDVPTTKTSTALLALSHDEVAAAEPGPCINCGRCVEVCPGRVVPSKLADCAEQFDEEGFLKGNGMECCECGCCSFICPAKRPLTQEIKSMRKMQLAKKKK
jgi:electron transport complex protein RnfC